MYEPMVASLAEFWLKHSATISVFQNGEMLFIAQKLQRGELPSSFEKLLRLWFMSFSYF